jgi:3-oxoadipate enol-lactonase
MPGMQEEARRVLAAPPRPPLDVGRFSASETEGDVPIANVNGIEIAYARRGRGARLLVIGGSGQTLETSLPMVKPFVEHFDVVVYDQRGLGSTAKPRGPYMMADYAADAAGLLAHLGWERSRVVGISFGGMVAQELAVTWPARVERLALACTSPGGPDASSYPLHTLESLSNEERARRMVEVLDTRFTPAWLDAHPDDRALVDLISARHDGALDAEVRRGMSEQLMARSRHDVVDRLGRISCPTLVACGRYDGIAPLANGTVIAARVADAELRTYEGGHMFFVQDAQAFPDLVDFLGR